MVHLSNVTKMRIFENKVGKPYSAELVVEEPNWRELPLFGSDIEKTYKDKLNKFGLLSLYPHLINVMENNPKPKFTDVLRLAGKKVTSFGNTRTTLKRLGVIDYNGSTMIKGNNWNKFVNDKWDWFDLSENHKVTILK